MKNQLWLALIDISKFPHFGDNGTPVEPGAHIPRNMVKRALESKLAMGNCRHYSMTTGVLLVTSLDWEELESKPSVVYYLKTTPGKLYPRKLSS